MASHSLGRIRYCRYTIYLKEIVNMYIKGLEFAYSFSYTGINYKDLIRW